MSAQTGVLRVQEVAISGKSSDMEEKTGLGKWCERGDSTPPPAAHSNQVSSGGGGHDERADGGAAVQEVAMSGKSSDMEEKTGLGKWCERGLEPPHPCGHKNLNHERSLLITTVHNTKSDATARNASTYERLVQLRIVVSCYRRLAFVEFKCTRSAPWSTLVSNNEVVTRFRPSFPKAALGCAVKTLAGAVPL